MTMNSNLLFVLGASDPEMQAIENLLTECGVDYCYAIGPDGQRVHPGNAYKAVGFRPPNSDALFTRDERQIVLVECDGDLYSVDVAPIVIDHHRPGDAGYGKSPADFLSASSIGQVISLLGQRVDYPPGWMRTSVARHPHWCGAIEMADGRWVVRTTSVPEDEAYYDDSYATACVIPSDLVLTAAADHCLAAAYRGECPGVNPEEVMAWRIMTRSDFQRKSCKTCNGLGTIPHCEDCAGDYLACPNCSESALLIIIKYALIQLRDADEIILDRPMTAKDMRGRRVSELPEAASREGLCFVADGLRDPDGRVKTVCQSGSPEQIRAFMEVWAPAQGLADIYGDPARGFAGGYAV